MQRKEATMLRTVLAAMFLIVLGGGCYYFFLQALDRYVVEQWMFSSQEQAAEYKLYSKADR